ncbi:hypothetical protein ACFWHT_03460 [Microbacterium sp. NPDC058342]|uniref:hypothetical protein n=1 Tax=Microbacterium sp. NPDC058342 TaxID=3346454 RepID=UPI0036567978
MEQDQQSRGISRRTFTRAAAWSVPVVAVAASVPLAAASTTPPMDGLFYSVMPGGEGNTEGTAGFTIFNNTGEDFDGTVSIRTGLWPYPFTSYGAIDVAGSIHTGQRALEPGLGIIARFLDTPVTVPANGQLEIFFVHNATGGDTQGSLEMISIITGTGTVLPVVGDATVYTPFTPTP